MEITVPDQTILQMLQKNSRERLETIAYDNGVLV